MPPAIARTATTEPATMSCRLTFARLAWRSRSARSRSRAAVFAAALFRLLMLVISIWDAYTSYAEYVWGTWVCSGTWGVSDREEDRARRSTPSQGVHQQPLTGGGRAVRGTRQPADRRGAAARHRGDGQQ